MSGTDYVYLGVINQVIINNTDKDLFMINMVTDRIVPLPSWSRNYEEAVKKSKFSVLLDAIYNSRHVEEGNPFSDDGTLKVAVGHKIFDKDDRKFRLKWTINRHNPNNPKWKECGYIPLVECNAIVTDDYAKLKALLNQFESYPEAVKAVMDGLLHTYDGIQSNIINCSKNDWFTIVEKEVVKVPGLKGEKIIFDDNGIVRQKISESERFTNAAMKEFGFIKEQVDEENEDLFLVVTSVNKSEGRKAVNLENLSSNNNVHVKRYVKIKRNYNTKEYFDEAKPILFDISNPFPMFRSYEAAQFFIEEFDGKMEKYFEALSMIKMEETLNRKIDRIRIQSEKEKKRMLNMTKRFVKSSFIEKIFEALLIGTSKIFKKILKRRLSFDNPLFVAGLSSPITINGIEENTTCGCAIEEIYGNEHYRNSLKSAKEFTDAISKEPIVCPNYINIDMYKTLLNQLDEEDEYLADEFDAAIENADYKSIRKIMREKIERIFQFVEDYDFLTRTFSVFNGRVKTEEEKELNKYKNLFESKYKRLLNENAEYIESLRISEETLIKNGEMDESDSFYAKIVNSRRNILDSDSVYENNTIAERFVNNDESDFADNEVEIETKKSKERENARKEIKQQEKQKQEIKQQQEKQKQEIKQQQEKQKQEIKQQQEKQKELTMLNKNTNTNTYTISEEREYSFDNENIQNQQEDILDEQPVKRRKKSFSETFKKFKQSKIFKIGCAVVGVGLGIGLGYIVKKTFFNKEVVEQGIKIAKTVVEKAKPAVKAVVDTAKEIGKKVIEAGKTVVSKVAGFFKKLFS